jgi:GST-like protein
MIDLYSLATPNGQKIGIALEELGLEYTPHLINIGKGEQFAESFLKISPNNKIPALVDHTGLGGKEHKIFESGT